MDAKSLINSNPFFNNQLGSNGPSTSFNQSTINNFFPKSTIPSSSSNNFIGTNSTNNLAMASFPRPQTDNFSSKIYFYKRICF